MKSYDVIIHMKALCLCFHMMLFIFKISQNEISKFGGNFLLANIYYVF